ncbi:4'-phosphopantetheinyl transferase superfamily protein [Streptomyces sp. HNM0574]|nr:4'-phosphopantetheinyl transferase superfamily protein [Streptomyces sp. HNM0574]NLU68558.1 4'-phosphopantetheinyl transferase superfamily protein [Streptomyces sp. HNM0574]
MLRQPWTEPPADPLVTAELDERERARAAAFSLPHDRLLYLSAHIALRRVLAAYLDVRPGEIRFTREACPGCGEAHGRPAVAYPDTPLHFSLSHSNGLALFGVATEPVGVDVEKLPAAETVELCSSSLHPAEQEELERSASRERQLAFGRLWTRKEAYLKGLGTGLGRSLSADYLGSGPGPAGAEGPERPRGWTVDNVSCGSSHVVHVAAAAVRGDVAWPEAVRWLPADCLYAPDPAGLLAPLPLPGPPPVRAAAWA